MSLRVKLLSAFLLLTAAVLALSLAATRAAVASAARQEMQADLERITGAQLPLQIGILRRLSDVAIQGTFLTVQMVNVLTAANQSDAELGLGEEAEDAQGLEDAHAVFRSADLSLLRNPQGTLKASDNNVVLVVNRRGELVFSTSAPEAFGSKVVGVAVVDEALKGASDWDLWSGGREAALPVKLLPDGDSALYLVLSRPIVRGGALLGVLVLGERVERELAGNLRSLADAELVLRAQDGSTATTLPGADAAVAARMGLSGATTLTVDARTFLAHGAVLRSERGRAVGSVYLLRERAQGTQALLRPFQERLVLIGAGVMALAALASTLLARRMSSPLVRLEAAARRVSAGDLDVTLEVPPRPTRDEVARLSLAFQQMILGLRQRDQIKGLFKRYLNPQVVEELLKHPEKASPGGTRRELSVLFCDLVGFTSFSERLTPEALLALLNAYLEDATGALARRGATLDKFIGDAIMCFFNAPLLQADHAARACLTALELTAVVDRHSAAFERACGAPLSSRIGLNCGPAVVGNVGSKDAQEYTVMGDTVNLASRLEGAAKLYGVRTLASAETIERAAGAVVARELDLVRVQGRQQPVRVYELLGPAGTPLTPAHAAYAQGLQLYRARRFDEARAAFEAAGEDPPARVFHERCELMRRAPPPPDWAGVHALTTK